MRKPCWRCTKLEMASPEELELEEQKKFIADELRKYCDQYVGLPCTEVIRDTIKRAAVELYEDQFGLKVKDVKMHPDGRAVVTVQYPAVHFELREIYLRDGITLPPQVDVEIICRLPEFDWNWD